MCEHAKNIGPSMTIDNRFWIRLADVSAVRKRQDGSCIVYTKVPGLKSFKAPSFMVVMELLLHHPGKSGSYSTDGGWTPLKGNSDGD